MSVGKRKKFDNLNGARCINPKDGVKIAQKNGAYPNIAFYLQNQVLR